MYVDLDIVIYEGSPILHRYRPVPGAVTFDLINNRWPFPRDGQPNFDHVSEKLLQSCRKLTLMWYASEQALEAEADFYSSAFQEAPALVATRAIPVYYHLESFVLLSRSALDLAANVFGWLLPRPFKATRYDSFRALLKGLAPQAHAFPKVQPMVEALDAPGSWVSLLVSSQERRSLRDQVAHQMEFPIEYEDSEGTEKRHAVVRVSNAVCFTLPSFLELVRTGVIDGFRRLEATVAEQ